MSHDETHTRYSPSSASTYPSTASSSNRGDGPFDPGNTPPLVFAFIAIGFLTFGIIVGAIYKRCRPVPSPPEPHQRSSVPIRPPPVQKPELLDVWIAPSQRVVDEDRMNVDDWDNFVPLSASLVYPCSPSSPVRVPQQYVQGHVARPISWENPEDRLFFRRPPKDASLHVAVMVSMPRRQEPIADGTYTENEFHIGVTEVKWSR